MTISPKAMTLINDGPLVWVDIHDHPAMRGNIPHGSRSLPHRSVLFLVDTGSQMTFVEKSIITELGIAPTGVTVQVMTLAGEDHCMSYHAELVFALGTGPTPYTTTILGFEHRESSLRRPRYQGVLGRAALHRLKFQYDGSAGDFQIGLA